MHRLHAIQTNVNRLVHWRPGGCEYAGNGKRRVFMVGEAGSPPTMGQNDFFAHLMSQRPCNACAQHNIKDLFKPLALCQFERQVAAVTEVLQKVLVGSDHSIAPVAVSQGNRNQPLEARILFQALVGRPANVVGGIADVKHGVQQQVQLATAGTDDQVGATDGAGEGLLDLRAQVLDAQQQRHTQCQGQADQCQYLFPVPKAGQGQCQSKACFHVRLPRSSS